MPFKNVKTLFIDLDDTIWENNIFFEQSQAWLCRAARLLGQTDRAALWLLNTAEQRHIAWHGYGYDYYEKSVLLSLRAMIARGGNSPTAHGLHQRARSWTRFLKNHPIIYMPGVLETLPILHQKFQTIAVTKGHYEDQMGKVLRSEVEDLFHHIEVVPQKYPDNYRVLLEKYSLRAEETIMIGNSPRSDINAAKTAGLRTIYVHHPNTWHHEVEPILPIKPETLEITSFDQIVNCLE